MNQTATDPVLTICVISYNRGRRALQLVTATLPDMDDDWELLVLNNASPAEQTFYDQIEAMAATDPRLSYVCHAANREYHGNYLACFDHARAPWFMLCSDEDLPRLPSMRNLLPLLQAQDNLCVLRGSIVPEEGARPQNAIIWPENRYAAGSEALLHYGMLNNYISGTFYNRALAQEKGLVERLRQGIDGQRIYAHLYFELLAASQCDVMTTPEVVITEGQPQFLTDATAAVPMRYQPPYSFGSRIDQIIVLRDALIEAVGLVHEPFDLDLFLRMYLRLCEKYFRLVSLVNRPLYQNHALHLELLQKSLLYVCTAGISCYPAVEPYRAKMIEEITKIFFRYQPAPRNAGDATPAP
ncbi:MAG: glycosyltransferase [Magnetococcales bacterium]|nr:glycosyltransferase [Magnetococcales bacterium]